jgi:hypothetical protein
MEKGGRKDRRMEGCMNGRKDGSVNGRQAGVVTGGKKAKRTRGWLALGPWQFFAASERKE